MPHAPDDAVRTAETFGQVARALAAHDDLETTLQKVVELAVEHLDAAEYAGISRVEKGQVTSPASSGDIPRIIDKLQSETGEGPCVDAIKEHEVFQTGDLEAEGRWPAFAPRAHEETGVCSILSLRLFVEKDTMGALNLYSTKRDAFDDSDVALGAVFAVHAAVATQTADKEQGLEQKAASRDVIGRAKGILMARAGISDDEAFDLLRRASQRLNVKLVAVAEQIATNTTVSANDDAAAN